LFLPDCHLERKEPLACLTVLKTSLSQSQCVCFPYKRKLSVSYFTAVSAESKICCWSLLCSVSYEWILSQVIH
jgi:hypothetical protein